MDRLRTIPKGRWLRTGAIALLAIVIGWFLGSRLNSDSQPGDSVSSAGATGQLHRGVIGQIVRVSPADGVMTVDHEAVEGFMPAMTMDLPLADAQELAAFAPGDQIVFDLAFVDGAYRAVRLRSPAEAGGDRAEGSADEAVVDPLGRGDLVPDMELYDVTGKRFKLREMEPRHRVITFFYVRCPMQDFCPTQSLRLSRLQEQVADSPSGVHLVSLTLDAEYDDPDVLSDYAERYRVDPARWTLAGAEAAGEIRDFADRAGARIARHEDTSQIDHALVALRVDGDRIVDLVYGLEAIESLVKAM